MKLNLISKEANSNSIKDLLDTEIMKRWLYRYLNSIDGGGIFTKNYNMMKKGM